MYLMPDVTKRCLTEVKAALEFALSSSQGDVDRTIVRAATQDIGNILASLVGENEGVPMMDESSRQGPPPGEYYQGVKYPD